MVRVCYYFVDMGVCLLVGWVDFRSLAVVKFCLPCQLFLCVCCLFINFSVQSLRFWQNIRGGNLLKLVLKPAALLPLKAFSPLFIFHILPFYITSPFSSPSIFSFLVSHLQWEYIFCGDSCIRYSIVFITCWLIHAFYIFIQNHHMFFCDYSFVSYKICCCKNINMLMFNLAIILEIFSKVAIIFGL